LLNLGAYTVWRGLLAKRALIRQGANWQNHYIGHVGFTLISLFDGFTIVGAIDLKAPAPVVVFSYAPGAAGGIRGVEQLRQNVVELQMAPMREAIHIAGVLDYLDEDGKTLRGHLNERLVPLMSELSWWAKALKTARDQDKA
jgi:hypothetical protein